MEEKADRVEQNLGENFSVFSRPSFYFYTKKAFPVQCARLSEVIKGSQHLYLVFVWQTFPCAHHENHISVGHKSSIFLGIFINFKNMPEPMMTNNLDFYSLSVLILHSPISSQSWSWLLLEISTHILVIRINFIVGALASAAHFLKVEG